MEDNGRQLVLEKPTLSAVEVKAGLDLILQVMKTTMEKGKDYGLIPGCGDKPTLFKPGSEKILTAFRIGVDPEVEDLSTDDEAHYRVKARLFHEPSGIELGKGIGEASSYEEKYKWRKAICDEELDIITEDRKRLAYKAEWKDGRKTGKFIRVKQVRTNKADVANTVLKMAKKRAQIDGTLTATAASSVFNQDLEDLEAEIREAIVEAEAPKVAADPIKGPEAKPAAKTAANYEPPKPPTAEGEDTITFIPVSSSSKPDKNGKERFAAKSPAGLWYSTYDDKQGTLIQDARVEKFAVKIGYTTDGDFQNIVSVEKA